MIKLALVGCGGMANWHAQQLRQIEDVAVVALADTVCKQTAEFKTKYFPEAREYDRYEDLLERPPEGLDGVVLVTPHAAHHSQAKAALERGLHVLVEKPMVTSSPHAYDLWQTVNRTGRKLGITFQAPYTAEFQAIKALRDRGEMGKVQLIQGWLAQGWLKGTTGKWRQDPKTSGGGQMYDSGAHVLNAMMWIMNESVVEVYCMYDRCGSPVDINGAAVLKFESGALGSFCIGGNSPGWDTGVQVQTDRMQIKTLPHGGFIECTRDGRKFYPSVPWDSSPAAFTPHRNFIRALRGEEELQSPVRYGVLLSALMDAIYESASAGRPAQVKPVPKELTH